MDAPDLGDRWPSQMLADLLQLCPPGKHATAFFRAAFMKRLPAKVQVHLSGTEELDLKALALRADKLWLSHRRSPLVAAVGAETTEEAAAMVAAVAKQQQQSKKKKKLITFCFLHHKYGTAARRCEDPANCMWAEN
jgi:hypothetical protein